MNKRLPLSAGTVLQSRYTIVGQLGHGGMGAVYEAKDSRTSATVALKETYADDDYTRNAFEREAKMLANMTHEAFPRVMDYFAEGDGFYLVMELIRGKDLSELLEERNAPFETEQVLEWADQILDALEDLHSQDIVHRDIKPSNLKLTPRSRIKLLDFGIAKGAAGDMTALQSTVGSMAAATLQYAPLEQVLRADVNWLQMLCVHYSDKTLGILDHGTDARSDIYALGATLYHLLTNTLPVNAPTRALSVWSGLADKLLPAHEINPKVSPALSVALQRSLEIDRNKRSASAGEMQEELRSIRSSEPIRAKEKVRRVDDGARVVADGPVQRTPTPMPPPVVETPKPRPQAVPVMETPNWGGQRTGTAGKTELPEQETHLRNLSEDETRVRTAPANTGFDVPKNRKTAIIAAAILVPVVLVVVVWIYNLAGAGSTTSVTGSTGIELVNIPAGSFMMGSENGELGEKPVHKVTISKPFLMGKYEVTQEQWQSVMGSNPSKFSDCPKCPVELVSWDDAQSFISKLNGKNDGYVYRLPTEAEWEYACRAGTTGDNYGDLDSIAWYEKNSGSKTHPAGGKKANAFGLYDMSGNVWEWCQDWYGNYSSGDAIDPTGAEGGNVRVLRGGSWKLGVANDSRSAIRSISPPTLRFNFFGFRLAARVR